MARAKKGKSAPPQRKAKPAAPEAPAEAVTAPAVVSLAERAEKRRTELTTLKQELAASDGGDPVTRWLNAAQANDVRAFVASKSKQADQRRYQMSLVKNFIDDPSRFSIDPTEIPTSTSLDEFAERRRDLEYRIALMRTFVEILSEELKALGQAEESARKEGAGRAN